MIYMHASYVQHDIYILVSKVQIVLLHHAH